MTADISMIVIKHFKQEVGRSILDICLDKEIPNLLTILPAELEKCFFPKFGDKNLFRSESDRTEALLLDVMKYLRLHKWNLLTSNSFAHLSLEKTVESHFYFEKITKSKSSEEEEQDDEKVKAFTTYLKQQFEEYEIAKLKGADRRQFSYDSDQSTHGVGLSHGKHSSPIGAQKPVVPPEVMALIMEKSSQQTGPYAFAKRAAGVSPTRRPLGPEVTENFSKAQRDIAEAAVEADDAQQVQAGEVKPIASLPPLPPGIEKKAAPSVSNRLVEKYQPIRKSIAGISPQLSIQQGDVDHDADVSNFFGAKNEISELNPLHGSTPRGTTPVPTMAEETIQPQTLFPINVPTPVAAAISASVPLISPSAMVSPVVAVHDSSSVSAVAGIQVAIPSPTERLAPSPVPTPNASIEPSPVRQPSAADKLLSKYRRKSSFSVNKSTTGSAAAAVASQVQTEESSNGIAAFSPMSPATDNTTIAAAAAASKRASVTSSLSESAASPNEHAASSIPIVETSSTTADVHAASGSASGTPKKRTSFFTLQNGGIPRDTDPSVVEPIAAVAPTFSSVLLETSSAIPEPQSSVAVTESVATAPKPSLKVIELSVEVEKAGDESKKKSPTSVTPPSSTGSSTGKSFLSRYATKKRSITSNSGNNLKAELQQAKDTLIIDSAPTVAAQLEGSCLSLSAEQQSSLDTSITAPASVPQSMTATSSVMHVPTDDILQSLPEIPTASLSHQSNTEMLASHKADSMNSSSTAVIPAPPAAESVIAILEAQATTFQSATSHSLVENIEIKRPFANAPVEETHGSENKEVPIPEQMDETHSDPITIDIPVSVSSFEGSNSASLSATAVETAPAPVPVLPTAAATSAMAATTPASAPATTPASAPATDPAPTNQEFEVEYVEKLHIASASSLMRQIASSNQGDASPEVQQHESDKTSHYSKLGSAFVTSNVLGRGAARGGGRGRGRGL